MAGEAGEVCNAVKKLRRIEDEIASINEPSRQISTREEALNVIAEEIADTFLYLNLLCTRIGRHLPTEVVKKFNATSEKYGFPERLPAPLLPERVGGAKQEPRTYTLEEVQAAIKTTLSTMGLWPGD